MGFTLDYEITNGLTCSNAYWRIKRCYANIDSIPTKTYSVSGTLEIFMSKEKCENDEPAIGGVGFTMPMDMDSTTLSNPIAESYKYLKTQAEYSSAVDA